MYPIFNFLAFSPICLHFCLFCIISLIHSFYPISQFLPPVFTFCHLA